MPPPLLEQTIKKQHTAGPVLSRRKMCLSYTTRAGVVGTWAGALGVAGAVGATAGGAKALAASSWHAILENDDISHR